ncbi:hypothetical protein AYJ57_00010 [Salipiger sp. CCB-MM3]|nr:OmpA family protein [Salipiger sp. CCB-MM3]ANT61367.1 hypothetical protein AYJ57_00010 [Salipiger sp. CCB-MM3]
MAYDDGTTVETIKAADGRVLRRARILPDGQQVLLFDDTQQAQDVVVSELPQARTQRLNFRDLQGEDLAAALAAQEAEGVNRAFSLNQIRNIDRVRHLVPEISVDTVTFPTNSAAIRPGEAEELAALGNAMKRMIEQNPSEVFLIEGHTDATGSASYNLALSDRRAESVALALTEYFDVPPSNMVLQGYGESDLAVQSQGDERENRRAACAASPRCCRATDARPSTPTKRPPGSPWRAFSMRRSAGQRRFNAVAPTSPLYLLLFENTPGVSRAAARGSAPSIPERHAVQPPVWLMCRDTRPSTDWRE